MAGDIRSLAIKDLQAITFKLDTLPNRRGKAAVKNSINKKITLLSRYQWEPKNVRLLVDEAKHDYKRFTDDS